MSHTDARYNSYPWTVVLQGSLSFEDSTQLDKLEYAITVYGGPAVDRHLSQSGVVKALARALCEAIRKLTNQDNLIRAGKLLKAILEFCSQVDNFSHFDQFLSGLPDNLFSIFIQTLKYQKDVSSWYLNALGLIFGHRGLNTFGEQNNKTDQIIEQKTKYVSAVATTLAAITEECVLNNQEEEDDKPEEKPEEAAAAPIPTSSTKLAYPPTPSAMGYIPTVSDIGASMLPQGSASAGDEELGRILSGLAAFLSTDENRVVFCKQDGMGGRGPSVLAALLERDVGVPVQVYYQTVFCLWLISFVSQQDHNPAMIEIVSLALEEAAVPRRLTNVLRDVSAEKVVRISLATLRNILKMSVTLRKEMVGAGLVAALQNLCFRRWNDEDIRDDLGVLADALEHELASMSNFDVYRAEVLSGALEWTPVHRNDMFWQQNVDKLERNQQEVLRCMVRLLHESTDETVLAVACNDLAQFIKYHQRGRVIAQQLGVKARLMELMVKGEGEVRRYALNCVQVLMIRWTRQES